MRWNEATIEKAITFGEQGSGNQKRKYITKANLKLSH
jgi:hypothetical protein